MPVCLQGLQLKRHIDATLGQGNLIEAVRLPPGEDIKEWLAVNTVDFYNAISVLYSTLAEFCTESNCEVMSAGSKVGPAAGSIPMRGCLEREQQLFAESRGHFGTALDAAVQHGNRIVCCSEGTHSATGAAARVKCAAITLGQG
jgi:hypothetical protein